MRKMLITATIASVLVASGASVAKGPSGSSEGRTRGSNSLRCAKGTDVQGLTLFSAERGAEVCNDGGTIPVHGRVIVDVSKQYVAADGDKSNPGPAAGYARVDSSGPHCSDGRDQDATRSRTGGDPSTCDAD